MKEVVSVLFPTSPDVSCNIVGNFQLILVFSVASDDLFEDKQRGEMPRDDYWYYDVASDGYYYEQNGAKGWRRRMPNSALHKIKEQVCLSVVFPGFVSVFACSDRPPRRCIQCSCCLCFD